MVENFIVLALVAAAGAYTIFRLRSLAAGESKCACGTKSCGAATPSCGGGNCNLVQLEKPNEGA